MVKLSSNRTVSFTAALALEEEGDNLGGAGAGGRDPDGAAGNAPLPPSPPPPPATEVEVPFELLVSNSQFGGAPSGSCPTA